MVEPEHFVPEKRQLFQILYDHIRNFGYDSSDQFVKRYFPKLQPRMFRLESNVNEKEYNNPNDENDTTTIHLKSRYHGDSSPSSLAIKNQYIWREIFHDN